MLYPIYLEWTLQDIYIYIYVPKYTICVYIIICRHTYYICYIVYVYDVYMSRILNIRLQIWEIEIRLIFNVDHSCGRSKYGVFFLHLWYTVITCTSERVDWWVLRRSHWSVERYTSGATGTPLAGEPIGQWLWITLMHFYFFGKKFISSEYIFSQCRGTDLPAIDTISFA